GHWVIPTSSVTWSAARQPAAGDAGLPQSVSSASGTRIGRPPARTPPTTGAGAGVGRAAVPAGRVAFRSGTDHQVLSPGRSAVPARTSSARTARRPAPSSLAAATTRTRAGGGSGPVDGGTSNDSGSQTLAR